MKKSTAIDAEAILHNHDFRATTVRVALIETLAEAPKPLTAAILVKKLRRFHADSATIYRGLSALTDARIIRQLSLIEGTYSYDLAVGRPHGHHIICESCNTIETIPFCVRGMETNAKEKSRLFKTISSHALSFSGTCKKCARAVR
jgi:Fe2+ or Zn2+ uptake regulation protein